MVILKKHLTNQLWLHAYIVCLLTLLIHLYRVYQGGFQKSPCSPLGRGPCTPLPYSYTCILPTWLQILENRLYFILDYQHIWEQNENKNNFRWNNIKRFHLLVFTLLFAIYLPIKLLKNVFNSRVIFSSTFITGSYDWLFYY